MDLHALPKAELHCHLDGIISPAMAHAIRRADPSFPLDPEEFARYYPVADFASFMRWWEGIDPIEGDLAYFHPILAAHIAQLKADRVRYAEVMIAGGELPPDPGAAVAAVQALRAVADRLEEGAIQVEFLVGIGRSKPLERVEALAALSQALHAAGLVVGVALAGPEAGYPVRPFQRIFARLHDAGLGIEIHAGEWVGPESVWDALEYGHPDRIGHGVCLFQDPRLIAHFQASGQHIEFCPTSNLKTGGITRLADHPVGRARDLGLRFSVNTDDPGCFENSMTSEYALLAAHFDFTEADFWQLYANTLAARFQPTLRIEALAGRQA